MNTILPGQRYRHFKGNEYEIICIARHTEDDDELVVYRSVKNPDAVYARPIEMFLSKVDKVKYPEAVQELRFEPITDVESASAQANAATSYAGMSNDNVANISEKNKTAEERTGTSDRIAPEVLDFLDTDDFEEKLRILADMRGKVTEAMLDTMAFSVDFEFNDGSVDDKYNELVNCISLRAKFESNRLR